MKKYWIGVDIGSISVNGVILNWNKDIIKDYYLRHKGQPLKGVIDLFKEMLLIINIKEVAGISATGSCGKLLEELLGCNFVNEIVARTKGNIYFYPEIRTIIEIGGEDSKFISLEFDESSGKTIISDFAMNAVCAAGTGSFLDQQASRLGISIEEFGKIALQSKDPSRIASRCSVFAKTDMIHLQQRGTPTCDIIAGLCYALARNFKAEIAKGKEFHKSVSFQGGVAANIGVVRAFEDILGLAQGELIIPPNFTALGAIGAVLVGMKKGHAEINFENLGDIEKRLKIKKPEKKTSLKSLCNYKSRASKSFSIVDNQLSINHKIDAYLGVDVGSISTNLVVLDGKGALLTKKYLMTAGKPIEAVRQGLKEIGEELGNKVNIKGVSTTGSGRYMIGDIIGADIVKNEITTQARAAMEIDKNVDTIFEIGGQDSKYISINNGVVVDFEMNKICAAGTGSFLEEQSERLNLNIKKEFNRLAIEAKKPVQCGERCTVFMQSDIGHYQAHGAARDDIAAGLSYSIVQNYLHRVVRRKKIGKNIFFQGGVAFNQGVVAAFEKVLGKKITIPPNHEVTGAIGCAMIAIDNATGEKSKFKGFDLVQRKYKIKSFVCQDCPNNCEINKIIVENEKPLFYGSRCGKYDIEEKKVTTDLPDLFAEREKLLLGSYPSAITHQLSTITIGIPRALVAFYDFFPFWNTFFTELGFKVVLSDKSNRRIIQEGLENVAAEFCFPIKITHGHVLNLIEKGVDYIFLPIIIDLKRESSMRNTLTCPYVQALPDIIEASLNLQKKRIKICRPVLHYRRGKKHIEKVLIKMCKEFKISNKKIRKAIQCAFENQDRFLKVVKKRGEEIIRNLKEEDQQAIVIIGRLYNTCDAGVNLKIPEKLKERNVMAIPIDYLPLDKVDISKEWPDMYWHHGQKILKAAKFINENKNLYTVYLTNFGCGPDSFILSFFYRTMTDKPYLEIEIDEHSADVGVITRCEAFLESLQNMRGKRYPMLINKCRVKQLEVEDKPQDRRTVYLPRFTDHWLSITSALRACGIKAETLPEPDEENLLVGRKFLLGKECLACTISTADIIKKVQSKGFNPEKSAFLATRMGGPCRVGQYRPLQEMIINEISNSTLHIPVYKDPAMFQNPAPMFKNIDMNKYERFLNEGILAVDMIIKALHEIRPYEINQGETEQAYKKCLEKICQAIENSGNLIAVMKESREVFEKIEINHEQKKTIIGLTGQVFYIYNKVVNNNVVKKLEELGVEVRTPMVMEVPIYQLFAVKYIYKLKKEHQKLVKFEQFFKHLKDRMEKLMKPWKGFLKNYEEPAIEEIVKYNSHYLDPSIILETALSIGKTIHYIKTGLNGVILLKSFSCMPGTISEAIISKRLREDVGNFPFLTIAYDALEETNIQTRIEAFIYQAKQYKKLKGSQKKTGNRYGIKIKKRKSNGGENGKDIT